MTDRATDQIGHTSAVFTAMRASHGGDHTGAAKVLATVPPNRPYTAALQTIEAVVEMSAGQMGVAFDVQAGRIGRRPPRGWGALSVSQGDDRYREQRDYWRERYFDLAAGVVAMGNLGLLDLLDGAEGDEVRHRATRVLEVAGARGC
jgi:hypothetical protein